MDHLIKPIVESYPELRESYPDGQERCSWVLFSNDGKKVDSRPLSICHMGLTPGGWAPPATQGIYDQLITSYPAYDLSWFAFWDVLILHLFKQWKDILHLEQTSEGQYYVRVSDLSAIPADVLYSLCIFTRVPWEFPHAVKQWERLVNAGMHPGFAFAVCRAKLGVDDKVLDVMTGGNSDHWPIDRLVSIDRLVEGKPTVHKSSYKTNHNCLPCNQIWGVTSLALKDLTGQTVPDFWNTWKEKHEDILLASR